MIRSVADQLAAAVIPASGEHRLQRVNVRHCVCGCKWLSTFIWRFWQYELSVMHYSENCYARYQTWVFDVSQSYQAQLYS
jgi:hypothetical protein